MKRIRNFVVFTDKSTLEEIDRMALKQLCEQYKYSNETPTIDHKPIYTKLPTIEMFDEIWNDVFK